MCRIYIYIDVYIYAYITILLLFSGGGGGVPGWGLLRLAARLLGDPGFGVLPFYCRMKHGRRARTARTRCWSPGISEGAAYKQGRRVLGLIQKINNLTKDTPKPQSLDDRTRSKNNNERSGLVLEHTPAVTCICTPFDVCVCVYTCMCS